MTTRRELLRMLGAGALMAGASPAGGQQRARTLCIGVLWFVSSSNPWAAQHIAVFRQRLRELGYEEGKTVVIDERYAEGNAQRLSELARELVATRVDVIVASAVAASTAARQATAAIPIVMVHAGNPVGAGLITSLARPGGNVTGTANLPLGGKHVDLLRELVPRMTKLAILANPTNAGAAPFVASMTDAARSFNIGVVVAEVTRAEDFPSALATIRNARPDALHVAEEPMISGHRAEIVGFAAGARLPLSADVGAMARLGGLVSYAPLFTEHYAAAAVYVDKILRGAKPADLPVEQPTRFELILNLKTAKALGITIPESLLLRADEVIR